MIEYVRWKSTISGFDDSTSTLFAWLVNFIFKDEMKREGIGITLKSLHSVTEVIIKEVKEGNMSWMCIYTGWPKKKNAHLLIIAFSATKRATAFKQRLNEHSFSYL